MSNYNKDLSDYRLSKAKDDLSSAELLFKNKHFAQSINRSYYAIFHSVRALLAYDEFDSKKHSWIISYFNRNYVKEGKIEKKYSRMLIDAKEIRTSSDYDDLYIADKKTAEEQLKNAKEFIAFIENYIRENKG